MIKALHRHPFPVEATLGESTVLAYALPPDLLSPLIPDCLELDLFKDTWAFVAVAMVETRDLRPKGFPRILGRDFFLAGYRIFVRYRGEDGRRLRGLYILKSETDRRSMVRLGNLFTSYGYEHQPTEISREGETTEIRGLRSGLRVRVDLGQGEEPVLPEGSPFSSWKEARLFAGPMPFTFSFEKESSRVVIVEGGRQNWKPKPLRVETHLVPLLDELGIQEEAILANAFRVEEVNYEWKAGRTEIWRP